MFHTTPCSTPIKNHVAQSMHSSLYVPYSSIKKAVHNVRRQNKSMLILIVSRLRETSLQTETRYTRYASTVVWNRRRRRRGYGVCILHKGSNPRCSLIRYLFPRVRGEVFNITFYTHDNNRGSRCSNCCATVFIRFSRSGIFFCIFFKFIVHFCI